MDKIYRRTLFFILGIVFAPLGLFGHLTFEWWTNLKKGNVLEKILHYILAPIYYPLALFMHVLFDWWVELF